MRGVCMRAHVADASTCVLTFAKVSLPDELPGCVLVSFAYCNHVLHADEACIGLHMGV